MKKILLPFQGGLSAFHASLTYAAHMAMTTGAELIVLVQGQAPVSDMFINRMKNRMQVSRLRVDFRFIDGDILEEFRHCIHAGNIDQVVLPAFTGDNVCDQGLVIMRQLTLESFQISLLVTPGKRFPEIPGNMLFVYAYPGLKHIGPVIDGLEQYMSIMNTSVLFANIAKGPDREGEQELMKGMLKERHYSDADSVVAELRVGSFQDSLHDLLTEYNIQILAVAKQQISRMKDFFPGNFFRRICIEEEAAVLVFSERITEKSDGHRLLYR